MLWFANVNRQTMTSIRIYLLRVYRLKRGKGNVTGISELSTVMSLFPPDGKWYHAQIIATRAGNSHVLK